MFTFESVQYKDILSISSLEITGGRITALVGQSGSGKTTLLRLMNKMISPTSGSILFNGNPLAEENTVEHRRQVAMLTQTPALFPGTVRDNLLAGLRFQKRDFPEDTALLDMLSRVNLKQGLSQSVHPLSGGEKQRLSLARVLLLDAPVYLLDEPSSALDDATAEAIITMITDHVRQKGKTMVMVTHSTSMAERFSDEILVVSDGNVNRRHP